MTCGLDCAFEVKVVCNDWFRSNEFNKWLRDHNAWNSFNDCLHPFNEDSSYRRCSVLLNSILAHFFHLRIRQHIITHDGFHITLKVIKLFQWSINEKFQIWIQSLNINQVGRGVTFWREVVQKVDVLLLLLNFRKFDWCFIGHLGIILFQKSQNRKQCRIWSYGSFIHRQLCLTNKRCEFSQSCIKKLFFLIQFKQVSFCDLLSDFIITFAFIKKLFMCNFKNLQHYSLKVWLLCVFIDSCDIVSISSTQDIFIEIMF